MPRHALKPLPTIATLLRRRREELGLSARRVEAESTRLGERIPFPTLIRIEQGRQEPGIRRFYALVKLYRLPPDLIPDLMELEELAAPPPQDADVDVLYRRGVELWQEGQVGPALAHVFAVRQRVPPDPENRLLRQKALITFSVMARRLGRVRLALRLVEDLLIAPPEPSLLVNVFVQAAAVYQELGATQAALAFIGRAEAFVGAREPQQLGWVQHQKAQCLSATGDHASALAEIQQAIASFAKARDSHGEARARLQKARLLFRQGAKLHLVSRAAEEAAEFAEAQGHTIEAVYAQLLQGELHIRNQRLKEGVRTFEQALAHALAVGDRGAQFMGHYQLWKAYALAGDRDRAQFERDAAQFFVRYVDDASPEAAEVRALPEGGPHARRTRKKKGVSVS